MKQIKKIHHLLPQNQDWSCRTTYIERNDGKITVHSYFDGKCVIQATMTKADARKGARRALDAGAFFGRRVEVDRLLGAYRVEKI